MLVERGFEPAGLFEARNFREVFYHPAAFGAASVTLAEYDAPHLAATAMTGE